MSLLLTLHIPHVIAELESVLLTSSRKMFVRNRCYESPSTLEQNNVIALLYLFLTPCSSASIFNFEHVFHF